jgi:hypothetical protein
MGVVQFKLAMRVPAAEPGAGAKTRLTEMKTQGLLRLTKRGKLIF